MLNRYRAFSEGRRRSFWTSIACGMFCGVFTSLGSAISRGNSPAMIAAEVAVAVPLMAILVTPIAWFVSSLGPGEKRNHFKAEQFDTAMREHEDE